MRWISRLSGLLCIALIAGCAAPNQATQNSMIGAGVGAVAGAVIGGVTAGGNRSSSMAQGAALGGLLGAIGGNMINPPQNGQ